VGNAESYPPIRLNPFAISQTFHWVGVGDPIFVRPGRSITDKAWWRAVALGVKPPS